MAFKLITYLRVLFKRATRESFETIRKHYVANLVVAIAAIVVFYFFIPSEINQLSRYIFSVLTPLLVVATVVFVYHLAITPSRIYHEQSKQIDSLENRLKLDANGHS